MILVRMRTASNTDHIWVTRGSLVDRTKQLTTNSILSRIKLTLVDRAYNKRIPDSSTCFSQYTGFPTTGSLKNFSAPAQ